ncbi:uncharacterized protein Nmag_3064 [Natrialba magadii ATCC 43099]|uniref:Uncharacterized protein n=1 Tax=Natrialba magadii (strain ATCC 43099 / DSM 3394 / CCM 3739 / CIP 104546 / IAM 13178 / JCM 8861 / NBRC 102185 / NCIMB 2190 / MS3) TaxID=547559 RepID=D3SR60_NATMM|nr:hypothetical protein [Natrialba magadii]ADD06616.1 uncharacterized protein Nmag_3064 [Natrialba magadii ATCC 43099]
MLAGSNGRYYTEQQVCAKLEHGPWQLCLREHRTERWLVELPGETLLLLAAVEPDSLPRWAEIRIDGDTTRVVDTRRRDPPDDDGNCD